MDDDDDDGDDGDGLALTAEYDHKNKSSKCSDVGSRTKAGYWRVWRDSSLIRVKY